MNEITTQSDRAVVFWSCKDSDEYLHHTTKEEAIEDCLDGIDVLDGTVTVYGYARMIVSKPGISDADDLLDEFLCGNWEEYISEDGPDITDRMQDAALTFLAVVHEEFIPWSCEVVTTEEVDVAAWITDHRPDWIKNMEDGK
ncbi:hypothetical protein LCGC14_0960340 [marine sediment metagenome]|uniref:Uncharacterized protein n=1 Tax=marine sediment metagenome TaxID=412755 RepID=A0A0F9QXW1_9ZZZZ